MGRLLSTSKPPYNVVIMELSEQLDMTVQNKELKANYRSLERFHKKFIPGKSEIIYTAAGELM